MKSHPITICCLEIWTAHNGVGTPNIYYIGLSCPGTVLRASPEYSNKRRARSALSIARKLLREFRADPTKKMSLEQIATKFHDRLSELLPISGEASA